MVDLEFFFFSTERLAGDELVEVVEVRCVVLWRSRNSLSGPCLDCLVQRVGSARGFSVHGRHMVDHPNLSVSEYYITCYVAS